MSQQHQQPSSAPLAVPTINSSPLTMSATSPHHFSESSRIGSPLAGSDQYRPDRLEASSPSFASTAFSPSTGDGHQHEDQNCEPQQQPQDHRRQRQPQQEMTPSAEFSLSILSGMGSGALSSVAVAPLDLVKTRMQVVGGLDHVSDRSPTIFRTLRNVIRTEGYAACFRGLGPTLCTVPAFWGLYFPTYERCKSECAKAFPQWGGREDVRAHVLSAVAAGCVADVATNPLWVVRTRMQTEALHREHQRVLAKMRGESVKAKLPRATGMMDTVRGMYATGGLPIFWNGLTASLLGLSHVAIQFPLYEFFKAEARRRNQSNRESTVDLLVASFTSKVIASAFTYPHEVIRSRMMDSRSTSGGRSLNVMQTFRLIVSTEGYFALYSGLHVSLVRVLPNCCLTFVSYELINRYLKEHLYGVGAEDTI